MLQATRRLRREQRGAVLVLSIVMITFIFLPLAALAIDTGQAEHAETQAQAAADAGALAAADAASTTVGQSVAQTNDPSATVPTPGQSGTKYTVTVTSTVNNLLGAFLGKPTTNVSASAVAQANSGGGGASDGFIFASNNSCSGAQGVGAYLNNMTDETVGAVTSIGAVTLDNVNGTTLAAVNLGKSCTWSSGTGQNGNNTPDTITSGPNQVETSFTAWPQPFSSATSACTTSYSGSVTFSSSTTFSNQVICALNGTITFQNVCPAGTVSFIAQSITFGGCNGASFTPYYDGLSYYVTGTSALTLPTGKLNGGTVFAPDATINYVGCQSTCTDSGFFEGLNVTFTGNNVTTFTGIGPTSTGGGASLVQ
ncbi:MAG: hypothetical protein JOZ07_18045 [Solirubrobacterales bacterium]|nr:hypothetical protein [Solirubrobacterales bacterium]